MANNKRKTEFHDPDYPSKKNKIQPNSPNNRINRIKTIINNEFQTELFAKEQEIMTLSNRLLEAKNLLKRVRYAVVAQYYSKSKLNISEFEKESLNLDNIDDESATETQNAIHPSLKQLLGKRPVNYNDILQTRPTRKAAQTASTTISEKLRTKKEERLLRQAQLQTNTSNDITIENMQTPQITEPIRKEVSIEQMNSARGRNQTKHLIVVGNTSKYIGDEKSADGVTHKWLVYVRTKTEIPIEKIVNKVRFFLHPSYKPNDVVEISSPPFQLSRRGWGEFPIRVQLFFDSVNQQKPIQIIHTLVLDKKLTGFQTMGAETMVEMYLNKLSFEEATPIANGLPAKVPEVQVKKEKITQDIAKSSSNNVIGNGCNGDVPAAQRNSIVQTELENAINIKKESTVEIKAKPKVRSSGSTPPFDDNKQFFTYLGKDGKVKYIEIVCPDGSKLSPDLQNNFIKNYHNIIFNNSKKKTNKPKQVSLLKSNNISLLKSNLNTNNNINGIKKSEKVNQIYSSEYIRANNESIFNDHDYFITSAYRQNLVQKPSEIISKECKQNTPVITEEEEEDNTANHKINHREIIENEFGKLEFDSLTAAVQYLLRRIPLISAAALTAQYKASFPFIVDKLETFNHLPVPKKLSFEWLRAKLVNRFVRKHPKLKATYSTEDFWSTKEIIIFARKFAYTPFIQTGQGNAVEGEISLQEMIKNEIKRERVSQRSITANHHIYDWLNKFKSKAIILEDEILNVENDDKIVVSDDVGEVKNTVVSKSKELLLIGNSLKAEASFLNELCTKYKINLGLEEIVPGIMHSSAERVLIQVLKSFVEDTVRRSFSGKMITDCDNSIALQVDDVIKGLSSRREFDFLTNQHMGIIQPKQQIEN